MKPIIVTICLFLLTSFALKAGEESENVALARQMIEMQTVRYGFGPVPDDVKKKAIKDVGGTFGSAFVSHHTSAILILSEEKKGYLTALIMFPRFPANDEILKILNEKGKGLPGEFAVDGPLGEVAKGVENEEQNLVYSVTVNAEKLTNKVVNDLKTVFTVNEFTLEFEK